VVVDGKEDKLGQRASDTAGLSFDAVEVPAENLIGEENQGFYLAMQTLDRTRPTVAAASVGIARAALEHARDYAREREQFGQPIAEFQAIQFLLADMATDVAASRLLTQEAARLMDEGAENATLMSSHAKRFAADAAMNASLNAVQIFGGYGYTKDYPVEKLMRDAKLMQIYEGTAQVQRLVIARQVLAGAAV
jgi:acyl-CoA dehydrogenase